MHVETPGRDTEIKDQHDFDATVDKDSKVVLMVLAGVAVLAALVMSTVALVKSGERTTSAAPAAAQTAAAPTKEAAWTGPPASYESEVIGGSKLGPDGKKHDVFTTTEFAAKAGQPIKLKINNTDDVSHSITAPVAGVNVIVQPGTHTYTIVVKERGRFQWYCTIPCDTDANGWAMLHAGFMAGYITVT